MPLLCSIRCLFDSKSLSRVSSPLLLLTYYLLQIRKRHSPLQKSCSWTRFSRILPSTVEVRVEPGAASCQRIYRDWYLGMLCKASRSYDTRVINVHEEKVAYLGQKNVQRANNAGEKKPPIAYNLRCTMRMQSRTKIIPLDSAGGCNGTHSTSFLTARTTSDLVPRIPRGCRERKEVLDISER